MHSVHLYAYLFIHLFIYLFILVTLQQCSQANKDMKNDFEKVKDCGRSTPPIHCDTIKLRERQRLTISKGHTMWTV